MGLDPNQFGLVRPARPLTGQNRLCSDLTRLSCCCHGCVWVVAAMVVHVRVWAVPYVPLVPPRVDRGPKRCRLCSSSGCSVFHAGSKQRKTSAPPPHFLSASRSLLLCCRVTLGGARGFRRHRSAKVSERARLPRLPLTSDLGVASCGWRPDDSSQDLFSQR